MIETKFTSEITTGNEQAFNEWRERCWEKKVQHDLPNWRFHVIDREWGHWRFDAWRDYEGSLYFWLGADAEAA